MGKLLKTLLALVVVAGAATGIYAYRGGKKADGGLKLIDAQLGSITEKAVAVGQIQPRQKFSVKSKISGIVKVCRVEVGDRVKAGDPLFEIGPDPTPLELTEVDRRVESSQATDASRESRRPGRPPDVLPAGHGTGHGRRHGRADLQGHRGRDRRR